MSIEDDILLMLIEEKEPLYVGEFAAVLEINRFSVKKTLDKLIREKIVFFKKTKDNRGGVYGLM